MNEIATIEELDNLVANAVNPKDYTYSIKRDGKVIDLLTIHGTMECANRMNLESRNIKHEENKDSWLAVAEAYCPVRECSRWGAFEQPKKDKNGKVDPHAFTKAIHKAQRNALNQLIPLYMKQYVIARVKGLPLPKLPDNALPQTEDSTQSSVFAAARILTDRLKNDNYTENTFWDFIKAVFKVKSRKEMTTEQWSTLLAKINGANKDKTLYNNLKRSIDKWKK